MGMAKKFVTAAIAAILMIGATALLASCTPKENNPADVKVTATPEPVIDISQRPIPEQPTGGDTPVEMYGKLQVVGSQLCDESGAPVQLRGMSSHGLAWYGEYCNYDVIKWLRDDWKCTVYRASMYTTESGGYIYDRSLKLKVYEAVDACIELGMYVIVDWHMLMDNDPLTYKAEAIEFFKEITEHYGDCPNILYEIMNEPNGRRVTWAGNCKPYAEELIPAIREKAPNNIVLVGNPSWSSLQDEVIENPLKGYTNIAYTVHQYTNESQKYWPLDRMTQAMEKGMCVFVTEWGCTDADGDGEVKTGRAKRFLAYLDKNMISWVNWNISNKDEASACLKSVKENNGVKVSTAGNWTEEELSESGLFIREQLRNRFDEIVPQDEEDYMQEFTEDDEDDEEDGEYDGEYEWYGRRKEE